MYQVPIVAPYTGAWIEIVIVTVPSLAVLKSHPTRVRGLKYITTRVTDNFTAVAPYTGAWIEI